MTQTVIKNACILSTAARGAGGALRLRMFEQGNYQSRPVERGPQPEHFYL